MMQVDKISKMKHYLKHVLKNAEEANVKMLTCDCFWVVGFNLWETNFYFKMELTADMLTLIANKWGNWNVFGCLLFLLSYTIIFLDHIWIMNKVNPCCIKEVQRCVFLNIKSVHFLTSNFQLFLSAIFHPCNLLLVPNFLEIIFQM